MSIPLLEYSPTSQNHRVVGYEIPGEEQPKIYNSENLLSASEMDELIELPIARSLNEQQMLRSNRQRELESQLRNGQITVRDFIQGLVLSESFRDVTMKSTITIASCRCACSVCWAGMSIKNRKN